MEGRQLDEFIDSLPPSLRLKVVSHLEPNEAPTGPIPVPGKARRRPLRAVPSQPAQIGSGGLSAWQKAVVVLLVAPVLIGLAAALWMGKGAGYLYEKLFTYTKGLLK